MQKNKGKETEESESFEAYSSEEEYSDEESQDTAKKAIPRQTNPYARKSFGRSGTKPDKEGGKGLKVKKGQKLSLKQLNILESASEVRKTSTNPLCKEKPNLFRCLLHFEITTIIKWKIYSLTPITQETCLQESTNSALQQVP